MPHIYNFENCIGDIKEVKINPKGWINPITIEYGINQHNVHDPMLSIVWRVKGTTHTFSIYERRLNVISHSNYEAHFTEALEKFREDYLSWFEDEDYRDVEWKYDYEKQYGKYILPRLDESENNRSEN